MKASHTPGPWNAVKWEYPTRETGRKVEHVVVSPALLVATLNHGDEGDDVVDFVQTYEEGAANARLIAAAPDLLAALEACASRWDKDDEEDAPGLGEQIRAAIAKARG